MSQDTLHPAADRHYDLQGPKLGGGLLIRQQFTLATANLTAKFSVPRGTNYAFEWAQMKVLTAVAEAGANPSIAIGNIADIDGFVVAKDFVDTTAVGVIYSTDNSSLTLGAYATLGFDQEAAQIDDNEDLIITMLFGAGTAGLVDVLVFLRFLSGTNPLVRNG